MPELCSALILTLGLWVSIVRGLLVSNSYQCSLEITHSRKANSRCERGSGCRQPSNRWCLADLFFSKTDLWKNFFLSLPYLWFSGSKKKKKVAKEQARKSKRIKEPYCHKCLPLESLVWLKVEKAVDYPSQITKFRKLRRERERESTERREGRQSWRGSKFVDPGPLWLEMKVIGESQWLVCSSLFRKMFALDCRTSSLSLFSPPSSLCLFPRISPKESASFLFPLFTYLPLSSPTSLSSPVHKEPLQQKRNEFCVWLSSMRLMRGRLSSLSLFSLHFVFCFHFASFPRASESHLFCCFDQKGRKDGRKQGRTELSSDSHRAGLLRSWKPLLSENTKGPFTSRRVFLLFSEHRYLSPAILPFAPWGRSEATDVGPILQTNLLSLVGGWPFQCYQL